MSFDRKADPDGLRDGFRSLKSLNEGKLAPGAGLLLEPEKDYEVFIYARSGPLLLKTEAGATHVLEVGECRRWSVPSGFRYRAFNKSATHPAQFFEFSITPNRDNVRVRAEQKRLPAADRKGALLLLASPDGKNASLRVRQDVRVYSSLLDPGHHLVHELTSGRGAWVHVVEGSIQLLDRSLFTGDGASLVEEPAVSLTAREPSEILVFDVA